MRLLDRCLEHLPTRSKLWEEEEILPFWVIPLVNLKLPVSAFRLKAPLLYLEPLNKINLQPAFLGNRVSLISRSLWWEPRPSLTTDLCSRWDKANNHNSLGLESAELILFHRLEPKILIMPWEDWEVSWDRIRVKLGTEYRSYHNLLGFLLLAQNKDFKLCALIIWSNTNNLQRTNFD